MSVLRSLLFAFSRVLPRGVKDLIRSNFRSFFPHHLQYSFTRDGHELDVSRFDLLDIEKAINKAKERFPNCKIYVVSDLERAYRLNEKIINTNELDKVLLKHESNPVCFVCAIQSDEDLLSALNKIRKLPNSYYFPAEKGFPPSRYFHQNNIAKQVLLEAREIGGKFDFNDFENIIQAIETTRNVEGDYVEIGTFQGHSARVALSYMKKAHMNRTSYLIDVYEGIVFKNAEDSADGRWLGTHTETSVDDVKYFLREFAGVKIVKSNIIIDELPKTIEKIAVCNVDTDMYESVLSSLIKVAPYISIGGIIICEDAGHIPQLAGARLALSDFLQSQSSNNFVPIYMMSGQYFLIKCS